MDRLGNGDWVCARERAATGEETVTRIKQNEVARNPTARGWVAIAGIVLLVVGFVLLAVNDPGLPYGERKMGLEVIPILSVCNAV
jgi:hypothetical protein